MANYTLSSFVSTPTSDDKYIQIFDKNIIFKYSIDPNLSYFYCKNNYIMIKIDGSPDIILDFDSSSIAMSAIEQLNIVKKSLLNNI